MVESIRSHYTSNKQHNLPRQLTSFVGRQREINEIREYMDRTRSLTIIGTGGVGKTRLCLEIAIEALEDYQDGVWFVELSTLFEPELVVNEIYSAMGLREEAKGPNLEDLSKYMRDKELMLILDNCEHLVLVCTELVSVLLLTAPNLHILATSREPLGYSGEVLFQVPAMKLPGVEDQMDVKEIVTSEAVQLLVERMQTFQPNFQIDSDNAAVIGQICYQLEGIPLALELAAARVNFLSLTQIATHLETSLQLLSKGSRVSQPRQQTMQATIEWSYNLLSKDEQKLFRCLSIFSGGFTLEDVESVCSGGTAPTIIGDQVGSTDKPEHFFGVHPAEVLDLLSNLVDKSLIVVTLDQEAIYRMLLPIQQFARDKLSTSNEDEYFKHRHLHHYLELAEKAQLKIRSAEQSTWLNKLEIEHDNLRAALAWSLESRSINEGLKLAGALKDFWFRHSYLQEGVDWFERLLSADHAKDRTYARALLLAGDLYFDYGNLELAELLAKQGLELCENLNYKEGIANGKWLLGKIAHVVGNRQAGINFLEDSLALFRGLGDKWHIAKTLLYLGDAQIRNDNLQEATDLVGECLTLFRELGDKWGLAFALGNSGELARKKGDHEKAQNQFQEALTLHIEGGNLIDVCYLLEHIAITAIEEGILSKAATLWGCAYALRESLHAPPPPAYQVDYSPHLVALRNSLGEGPFHEAWERGSAMDIEQAINLALDHETGQPSDTYADPSKSSAIATQQYGLTEREVEVLRLVAEGQTDAQVAEQLFISPRTVGKHLQSVYRKLQVNSRTAAARFALDQEIF
jgi:non-specific serine/threonine protein kinase